VHPSGFERFNGTAPMPASSGECDSEPVRIASTEEANAGSIQSCTSWRSPRRDASRARRSYTRTPARGHTKKEAMRVLKRHLSNVVSSPDDPS
jgi:transposase